MEAIRQNSVLSYNPNIHTSRNPHAFISRLPTEILQDIFIRCAQDYHYQYFKLSPTKSVPSWVNVSYVCHHWRNVAFGTPTLWTYLFIISQRWTEVLLARSEQASLRLNMSFDHVPYGTPWSLLSCVEMVMNHVERIQELTLHLPVSIAHRVLSKLSSRAPRLQDLDIVVEASSVEWPSLLFDGDPPALHSLKLVGCPVPLHSFRLDTLTLLHLVNVPVRFQQNMEEFLAALSHMQDLKYLHLCRALHSATSFLSSAVFKTFRKFDLTQLSRLWIRGPLSTVVTLLSCINIPLKTEVRLECDSEPNPSLGHYALLPSLLAQRYKDRAQSSPTILTLIIRFNLEGGVMLAFNPCQCDTMHGPWDDIHLSIELDLPMVDGDVIVNDICSFIPLSNVQTLLVIRPWFSLAFWRRILRQLQDVRYITLSGGNMPDFSILSLTDRTTRDSEGEDAQNHSGLAFSDRSQSHILAPRLEELELNCITFLPGDGYNLPEPAITRSCLFDALSTRRGSPGRLTITQSFIPGSGAYDMAAVWGDDGFHVVSEKVYPPELDWEYGYDDDDDKSVHSPEVDSDSDLEEEEGSAHSPEVDSDSDLDEEEECVHSPEVGSDLDLDEEEECVHSPEVDSDLDLEEEECVHSPEVDSEDLEEEVEGVGEGEECVYYPEADSAEEEEGECMYSSSSSPEVDSEDEECVHSFEGDASDWGDDMDDSGYSDDG